MVIQNKLAAISQREKGRYNGQGGEQSSLSDKESAAKVEKAAYKKDSFPFGELSCLLY
ncbi:hypothetical protein [Pseudobacillus wudalianchiensis]|uniref:hypothetical protein n=1 Tax=Pseudobacillus wudalianchiensis TaxID=1743143 RepID=UPI00159F2B98|nr:hypothetical protein [Bacillus wudalianchiensis]